MRDDKDHNDHSEARIAKCYCIRVILPIAAGSSRKYVCSAAATASLSHMPPCHTKIIRQDVSPKIDAMQSFMQQLTKLLPAAEADPLGPESARLNAVVFIRVRFLPDISQCLFQQCHEQMLHHTCDH